MFGTIPMICFGSLLTAQSLCFVPIEREMPQDIDPDLDCAKVWELLLPSFTPEAKLVRNCVLVEEPCGRGAKKKCTGGEWIR